MVAGLGLDLLGAAADGGTEEEQADCGEWALVDDAGVGSEGDVEDAGGGESPDCDARERIHPRNPLKIACFTHSGLREGFDINGGDANGDGDFLGIYFY